MRQIKLCANYNCFESKHKTNKFSSLWRMIAFLIHASAVKHNNAMFEDFHVAVHFWCQTFFVDDCIDVALN